jgi:hypothetical protein
MRLVAIAFAAATFIGASCPNPAPLPPPDVVVDASSDDVTPTPVVDASAEAAVDSGLSDVFTIDATVDSAPPAPSPKPSCQTACDAVRKVGCKEGSISNCAAKLCQINADPRFKHYDVACLTSATTPQLVRACGVDCTL